MGEGKIMPVNNYQISIENALLWTFEYFCILLLTEVLNHVIWRKWFGIISPWINLLTLVVFSKMFFIKLKGSIGSNIKISFVLNYKDLFISIFVAMLLYFILDKGLDPILEKVFPASEVAYQETINMLKKAPISSFIHICLIAPIIEETLMRGYILGGLQGRYGLFISLLVSSVLFALLHFNMVQTLSAFVSGLILGILYIKTGSIFCSILAHSLYNIISYIAMLYF